MNPKPHRNSGYDQKRGDKFGERDAHGGYVPERGPRDKLSPKAQYNSNRAQAPRGSRR